MIVTHTVNIHGQSRVYIGATGSLTGWIEPLADNVRWAFRCKAGLSAAPLPDYEMRRWATHLLLQLADLLNVAPHDLATVPYETITSLHNDSPAEHCRMPMPRKRSLETAFMASAPGITRPSGDFQAREYPWADHRR